MNKSFHFFSSRMRVYYRRKSQSLSRFEAMEAFASFGLFDSSRLLDSRRTGARVQTRLFHILIERPAKPKQALQKRSLLAVVVAVSVAVQLFGRNDDGGGDLVLRFQVDQAHALRGAAGRGLKRGTGSTWVYRLRGIATLEQLWPKADVYQMQSPPLPLYDLPPYLKAKNLWPGYISPYPESGIHDSRNDCAPMWGNYLQRERLRD